MTENNDHLPPLLKICLSWLAVLAGWTLQDWAAVAAIIASIFACIYTAMQMYLLWRDKLRRRNR